VPFDKYENMDDCISKNQDKENPGGFCADLHKQITGEFPAEAYKSIVWIRTIDACMHKMIP